MVGEGEDELEEGEKEEEEAGEGEAVDQGEEVAGEEEEEGAGEGEVEEEAEEGAGEGEAVKEGEGEGVEEEGNLGGIEMSLVALQWIRVPTPLPVTTDTVRKEVQEVLRGTEKGGSGGEATLVETETEMAGEEIGGKREGETTDEAETGRRIADRLGSRAQGRLAVPGAERIRIN